MNRFFCAFVLFKLLNKNLFVYLSKQRFDEIIGGNKVQVTHKIHCGDNTATLHDHDTVMVTQDFWIMEN